MINRLITIPLLPVNFNKELNISKQIAFNNSSDPKLIDKLVNKKNFNYVPH